MTQYVINIGTIANDGTGDPLRTAFNEVNLNFDQVFAAGPVLSNVQIANNTILTTNTNGNLILAPNGIGVVQSNVSIVPNTSNIRNLGSATRRWSELYVQYANVTGNIDIAGTLATGDLTVNGNLTVTGNTIQIGNLVTDAKTLQLANTAPSANAANGSGITVGANDNIATMLYSSSSNSWVMNIGIDTPNIVVNNISSDDSTFVTIQEGLDVQGDITAETISVTGNVTGNYILGNAAFMTGIPAGYANANVVAYANSGWAGNIIPAASNTYSLGNSTLWWSNIWVAGNTIFIGGVPVGMAAGNVLTVGGNAVLQNDSNTTISTTGNITADYFFGNGSQLTGIETSRIFNGDSNVEIATANGNVTVTANGTQTWTFNDNGSLNIPGSIVGTGTITIDNRTTGNSADINLYSADDITIQARDRTLGSESEGGDINIFAGDSAEDGDSSGGDVTIEAGRGGASNIDVGGSGGFITVRAGDGGDASTQESGQSARGGGDLTLRSGSAGSNMGNIARGSNGGDVVINAGESTGNTISGGDIRLNTGTAGPNALAGTLSINIPESDQGPGGSWLFDGTGKLTAPGSIEIGTGNIGVQLGSNPTGTGFYATIANITNGLPSVVVTLNDVEFVEGDEGTVRITGVVGETQANGFWGWQAIDVHQIQLYTDDTWSTPVDGTTWNAYVSGGLAVSSGYNNLDIQGGNVAIISGAGKYWSFNPDGTTLYPTLTVTRGDRTGTLTGQALVFGDSTQEAIISTPNGTNDINSSQRFVINPGAGAAGTAGEGGDIYLYAGRGGDAGGSGGDIKIRGGLGPVDGNGGYIDIVGGEADGNGVGGYIDILGGQSANSTGGRVSIQGGQGINGAEANIVGGTGSAGSGGAVNITGGVSSNGLPEYGNVNITAGASTWRFDNTGNLNLPQGGVIAEQPNPGGFPGYSTVLQPTGYINTDQKLLVYPTGGVDYNHLHLTSGNLYNTELFLGNDNLYVKLGNTGNVEIRADDSDGNAAVWTFDIEGGLTAPGNITTTGNVTAGNFVGGGSNVDIVAGSYSWTFDNSGVLAAPGQISATSISLSGTGTAVNASSGNILTNKVTGTQFAFLNGLYTATLTGGGATSDYTLNLPANAGSNGQVLTTDGSGNLSWTTAAGSYGNANVATFLAAYGSNTISTTGTITSGNILGNGYARLTGSFDESQASTAGLYLGYAGGTARIMFGTGNTNQTLEIDNDGGTLRFYKPGTTLASLTNSGVFSAAGNITGSNLIGSATIFGNVDIILGNTANASGTKTRLVSDTTFSYIQTGNGTVGSTGNIVFSPYSSTTQRVVIDTATGNITANGTVTGANISAVGRVLVGNGNATTPSFGFTSDGAVDTGFYWVSDGNIGVTNNGVQTAQFYPDGVFKQIPRTANSLPSASTVGAGARAFVTDANSNAFANLVVGGGIYNVPVFSNGTNWYVG